MKACRIWIQAKIPDVELARFREGFPSVQFLQGNAAETQLESLDVAFVDDPLPEPTVQQMKNLKWLHVSRGGAYPFLTPSVKARAIEVTCSKGIHGASFSEFALACIFALAKRLPQCWENQRNKNWDKPSPDDVSGKTLGIIGLGTVGCELARKAKALGMHVLAMKRVVESKPDYVDELGGSDYLHTLLSRSDFVVISLASVPSTENMLREKELRAMKRTAFLVNLTAGKTVEEDALVRALNEGWIAGAALDAFPRQPLPKHSPLWNFGNIIISPRIAGVSSRKWEDALPIFERNLRLFLAGAKLSDTVNKELGY